MPISAFPEITIILLISAVKFEHLYRLLAEVGTIISHFFGKRRAKVIAVLLYDFDPAFCLFSA